MITHSFSRTCPNLIALPSSRKRMIVATALFCTTPLAIIFLSAYCRIFRHLQQIKLFDLVFCTTTSQVRPPALLLLRPTFPHYRAFAIMAPSQKQMHPPHMTCLPPTTLPYRLQILVKFTLSDLVTSLHTCSTITWIPHNIVFMIHLLMPPLNASLESSTYSQRIARFSSANVSPSYRYYEYLRVRLTY
jgi:hypothetical protein